MGGELAEEDGDAAATDGGQGSGEPQDKWSEAKGKWSSRKGCCKVDRAEPDSLGLGRCGSGRAG